jgi:UDP-N-acetylglucosamine 2-epimerase (non-hydrolysing)
MSSLKVITVVGTRPEIIRLSRLIPKLDKFTNHVLVHTGQNYDRKLNEIFFEDLELRQPDYFLNVDTSSMGAVMGDTMRKAEEVFLIENPDAVMILGDTNSAIAAVVAERMHIPVYHMEAGNRSFDNNVPEELNRRMVDHVSSFNLPYNDYSMRNLLNEGIHPRFIQKTGSPIPEIYTHFKRKIEQSTILEELKLKREEYFLLSLHRQENVDDLDRLQAILNSILSVVDQWNFVVVVSTHPRTRRQLEKLGPLNDPRVQFLEPFGYLDYNKLQMNAFCVLSDSGTISEESAILGFPAVCLRESIERPEALETGSIVLSGTSGQVLNEAIELSSLQLRDVARPEGYEIIDFSDRVLRFVLSTAPLSRKWRNLN